MSIANGKLAGLLSGNVVKERYKTKKVSEVMTPRAQLITEKQRAVAKDPIKAADRVFHAQCRHQQNAGRRRRRSSARADHGVGCRADHFGESKSRRKPARDAEFRLVVGAALSPVANPMVRSTATRSSNTSDNLVAEDIDCVAVSTAHGHTAGVGDVVKLVRDAFKDLTIIAGNVTSGSGVEFLAECGANAIKIGQGPGSICTTRIVAGVGIPQLTALYVAAAAAKKTRRQTHRRRRHHEERRHREGADSFRRGHPAAAFSPAAAKRRVKSSRSTARSTNNIAAWARIAAMKAGSAARYGHDKNDQTRKVAAEGIEALKEVSGSVDDVLANLIGGVQSGMGYLGAANLAELRDESALHPRQSRRPERSRAARCRSKFRRARRVPERAIIREESRG